MFSFQFSLVSFLFSNFSFLVSVFSFQCPKAEKLSLPRGSNLQPESFAHSFSSTKQPSASTENPDISFVTGSSPSTSPSTSARASAPTAKVGSGEEEEQKPETSSASSAIRFGDRRRKKRHAAAAGERRKRQLAREEEQEQEEEEECVNNFCEDEQVGSLSFTEESNVYLASELLAMKRFLLHFPNQYFSSSELPRQRSAFSVDPAPGNVWRALPPAF